MVKVFLAKELGFCWGVERSIRLAAEAKNEHPGDVTILKEIVHNRQVVDFFKKKGIGQTMSIDDISSGTLVISAHGVSPDIKEKAVGKGLNVIDTTCPIVENVHNKARKLIAAGYQIVLYGEPQHDEVLGVMGIDPDNIHLLAEYEEIGELPKFEGKIALLSQTTRGVLDHKKVCERMKEIYPDIHIEQTICGATDKRQSAIRELAPEMDLVLVVGSQSSGNSHRLRDLAEELCGTAYLLDAPDQLDWSWFEGVEKVGITAGASTPGFALEMILKKIHDKVGIDLKDSDPKIFEYKSLRGSGDVQQTAS